MPSRQTPRPRRRRCGRRASAASPAAPAPASAGVEPLDRASPRSAPSRRRARAPVSSAGITLVSLNTSASPADSSSGRSSDRPVGERRVGAGLDHEQPRRVARARRPERDQLLRQIIEFLDAHESITSSAGLRSAGIQRGSRAARQSRPVECRVKPGNDGFGCSHQAASAATRMVTILSGFAAARRA